MANPNVYTVDEGTFDSEVLKSDLPVLVDFWATWCGPCLALAPTIEEVANEQAGKLKVCKLNVDEAPHLAARYGIRSIPTIVLFKNGQVVDQLIGGVPKGIIYEMLKKV